VAISTPLPQTLFHLSLSPKAFAQFQELTDLVQGLQIQNEHDNWSYIWGSSIFSSSKTYKHIIGHRYVHPLFHKLWKYSYQNKRKFFSGCG